MLEALKTGAMAVVDATYAAIPRRVPDAATLRDCRIVAHRGAHDNVRVPENTLESFRLAREQGVWGIECDVRWSADLVPVIHHDTDTRRVFSRNLTLGEEPFARLREVVPEIPSLAEVIDQFGGTTHLMLELKAGHFPDPRRQREILREHLQSLTPGRDYHILALDPALFALVDFVPREYCLPVSELAVSRLSAAAIEGGFGGLLGHFLLLGEGVRRRHARAGQRIGTGFIASRNALFRELHRGVEWIFTNDAVKLQQIVNRHLPQRRE